MSDTTSSDNDCGENPVNEEGDNGVSSAQQQLVELNDRLVRLSERVTLCSRLMNDFKELKEILKKKSLQDVTLPLEK